MNLIVTVGISHKTADLKLRESLAVCGAKIKLALESVKNDLRIENVALLSTCNRTEWYFIVTQDMPCSEDFIRQLIHWWLDFVNIATDQIEQILNCIYTHKNDKALEHILTMAAGLDSMVLGEPQILGQLKNAYKLAKQHNTLGSRLDSYFQAIFAAAKQIRNSTQLGKNPISIAGISIDLAKRFFTDLSDCKFLIIGAGENSRLVLQNLLANHAKHISILNRTVKNAQNLINLVQSPISIEAHGLEKLAQKINWADCIISSTASNDYIITNRIMEYSLAQKKSKMRLFVDLAVPRDIDPNIDKNPDIYLYSVDDLRGIIEENVKLRSEAATLAKQKLFEVLDDLCKNFKLRDKGHAIEKIAYMRKKAHKIKDQLVFEALQELQHGAKQPDVIIQELGYKLTQKLLHTPTLVLKSQEFNAQPETILELLATE